MLALAPRLSDSLRRTTGGCWPSHLLFHPMALLSPIRATRVRIRRDRGRESDEWESTGSKPSRMPG